MSKQNAMAYIEMLAPTHTRTSCAEDKSHNAAFRLDGRVYNYCERCTLIFIAELASGEFTPTEEDDDE